MDYEELETARNSPQRMERMKPILDRIPDYWGKYLPDVGWDDLLLELDSKLSEIDPGYTIHQTKQKFGTLRFYFQSSDGAAPDAGEAMETLVGAAEDKSAHICEHCGAGGAKARHTGWIKTLCDDCAEKRHGVA